MADADSAHLDAGELTADRLRAVRFSPVKGFGRGYDQHEVDDLVAGCAATIDQLTVQLAAARTEIGSLLGRIEQASSGAAVDHAVNVLTTAQKTAEAILAQASDELERARDESTDHLERARQAAATLQHESERKARQLGEDAARRAATLEQNTTSRLARLTLSADQAQQEIDRESAALQSFRAAAHAKVEEFLDGVLDQVAEQYGRAHPLAAKAAATARHRSAGPAQQRSALSRGRRGLRLAARAGSPAGDGLKQSTPPSTAKLPRPREPIQGVNAH